MKEVVALVGSYDENARKTLSEGLSDFDMLEIGSAGEYATMASAHYMILRTLKIDRGTIWTMPNLKLIQRWGVGFDSVDIAAAGEAGVQVAITSGVNALPVAEYAILLMLAVYRNLLTVDGNVRSGTWKDDGLVNRSYVIDGKQLGLIGLGAIGRTVARKALGMGAKAVYYDMARLAENEERELGIEFRPFEELVASSDIVSLHLPLNNGTRNLIDASVLAKMKRTAILVNTARGGIVNEADLYRALRDGVILGAGIDVFEQEPVARDNPLLTLANVVTSCHFAGNTADNSVNMALRCVENIRRVRDGLPPTPGDLVNAHFLNNQGVDAYTARGVKL